MTSFSSVVEICGHFQSSFLFPPNMWLNVRVCGKISKGSEEMYLNGFALMYFQGDFFLGQYIHEQEFRVGHFRTS